MIDESFHFVIFTTKLWFSGQAELPVNLLSWLFATTKDTKRLFADIEELDGVGDDIFAVGALVGDFHPA